VFLTEKSSFMVPMRERNKTCYVQYTFELVSAEFRSSTLIFEVVFASSASTRISYRERDVSDQGPQINLRIAVHRAPLCDSQSKTERTLEFLLSSERNFPNRIHDVLKPVHRPTTISRNQIFAEHEELRVTSWRRLLCTTPTCAEGLLQTSRAESSRGLSEQAKYPPGNRGCLPAVAGRIEPEFSRR